MAFVRVDTITGFPTAWNAARDAAAGSLPVGRTSIFGNGSVGATDITLLPPPDSYLRSFVRLSFDPQTDLLIVSNGDTWADSYLWTPGLNNKFPIWTHCLLNAGSLEPSQGGLTAGGFTAYWFPVDGSGLSFHVDPNTGDLFQWYGDDFLQLNRSGFTFGLGYGSGKNVVVTRTAFGIYENVQRVGLAGELALDDLLHAPTLNYYSQLGAARPIPIKGISEGLMPPGITLSDAVLYASGSIMAGYTSLFRRGSLAWLGTRSSVVTMQVMTAAPVGNDRVIVIGWPSDAVVADVTGRTRNPIITATYFFNRVAQRLELEDIDSIPTAQLYNFPTHVGFATFDSKRQLLVLMTTDMQGFERFAFTALCHPGRPSTLMRPAPLQPVHAHQKTTFELLTVDEISPIRAPQIFLSYTNANGNPASADNFVVQPLLLKTADTDGTGQFTVRWASAASGASLIVAASISSFSVAVCATFAVGTEYGADPIILSAAASVNVSASLSASLQTLSGAQALSTTLTILATAPTRQVDQLGVGAFRKLSYPTASFAPLTYELNPQRWTNIADEVLIRPLYASKKTAQKTTTLQFSGFPSDLAIDEEWLGGQGRIAMSRSQFSAMYAYFQNPPSAATGAFITWEPADVNNHAYQVVLLAMEVGGASQVELDHLFRTGNAWITAPVTLRLQVVSTVR